MPRKKRTAESAATAVIDHPDTSFDHVELERKQQAEEIVSGFAETTRLPEDAPTTTHAERVTRREPVVQSGLTFHRSDAVAGVKQGEGFRLVGNFKVREAVISFAEKPSREVITAMHDAGFAWKPADKLWTYTVGHQTAAQDRLHAERTFEQVAGLVRKEKGITHEFGG